ncbi:MAG: glycerol-3-phosphate 1-O-acyltransferase PlsY [Elainellaceae cyanobacterium]
MAGWIGWSLLTLAAAYVLGATPTGYLAGRWLKGIDIREHGSGSTGATNVLRTLGKGPGIAVLVIDMLKGIAAIALAQWAAALPAMNTAVPDAVAWGAWLTVLAGFAAILGHSRSVWLKFTGGKSVATSLGILIALHWPTALIAIAVFAMTVLISRMVSLGSMLGAIAVPVVMAIAQQPLPSILFGMVAALYILATHRRNIQRIFNGTESRLGAKKSGDPSSTSA